jgi:hypothetical protein
MFTLFNTNTGGSPLAGPLTNAVTGVTNGLFTTTVDFGAGVFAGENEWLEVAARTTNTSRQYTRAAWPSPPSRG